MTRDGDLKEALTVYYTVGGDANAGGDYAALPGTVMIPAGKASAMIALTPSAKIDHDKMVVVTLGTTQADYHVGCPSASLVVIRKSP